MKFFAVKKIKLGSFLIIEHPNLFEAFLTTEYFPVGEYGNLSRRDVLKFVVTDSNLENSWFLTRICSWLNAHDSSNDSSLSHDQLGIWYLNENGETFEFWGHYSLRNLEITHEKNVPKISVEVARELDSYGMGSMANLELRHGSVVSVLKPISIQEDFIIEEVSFKSPLTLKQTRHPRSYRRRFKVICMEIEEAQKMGISKNLEYVLGQESFLVRHYSRIMAEDGCYGSFRLMTLENFEVRRNPKSLFRHELELSLVDVYPSSFENPVGYSFSIQGDYWISVSVTFPVESEHWVGFFASKKNAPSGIVINQPRLIHESVETSSFAKQLRNDLAPLANPTVSTYFDLFVLVQRGSMIKKLPSQEVVYDPNALPS